MVDAIGDAVEDAVALGVAELDTVAELERVGGTVPLIDGAAERVTVCDTAKAPPWESAVADATGDIVEDAVALGVAELELVGGAVTFVDGAAERVAVCDAHNAPLCESVVVVAAADSVAAAVALEVAVLEAVAVRDADEVLVRVANDVPFTDGAADRVAVCEDSDAPPPMDSAGVNEAVGDVETVGDAVAELDAEGALERVGDGVAEAVAAALRETETDTLGRDDGVGVRVGTPSP